MDFCRNVSVSGGLPSEYPPETVISQESSKLDEFFPGENKELDVGLEWLSVFLEDCFSSSGYNLPQANPNPTHATHLQNPNSNPSKPSETHSRTSLQDLVVPLPGKARTKRRRRRIPTSIIKTPSSSSSAASTTTTHLSGGPHGHVQEQPSHVISSDPPLLHQTYWLAESELFVVPKEKEKVVKEEWGSSGRVEVGPGQPRRCSHCLAQRTPQWRAGPLGPKTLCNACGVRFKSGRLLPEYRPAKSPTFVSYKHSNSHKKVMEMRMAM
ncbi:hypothetical protein AAC387_Pa01g2866 [Persea americana]|eukprot:TRINITY_DN104948_c0_g1_i1.p1 TRINITY_DN104948_c0_g1~~TRINITY_DN104948_c0_g1_i1.p1  ORF type:complete len:304 (-),score=61.30 TRINITY_DN104948_c0_g1_i1:108-911(-)